ncbi:hypothetical protein [Paenibacillus algicola]|nr:hypothetical protein [Paenibacillus algicola]
MNDLSLDDRKLGLTMQEQLRKKSKLKSRYWHISHWIQKVNYIFILLLLVLTSVAYILFSDNNDERNLFISNQSDIQSMTIYKNVYMSNQSSQTITDLQTIHRIVNQINSAERVKATEIVFEKGPEGLLVFKFMNDASLHIPFFQNSGDVLYKETLIDADLVKWISAAQMR